MKNNQTNDSANLAGRQYETEDYKREDELSSGLATTHEQVSDSYMQFERQPDGSPPTAEVKKSNKESVGYES